MKIAIPIFLVIGAFFSFSAFATTAVDPRVPKELGAYSTDPHWAPKEVCRKVNELKPGQKFEKSFVVGHGDLSFKVNLNCEHHSMGQSTTGRCHAFAHNIPKQGEPGLCFGVSYDCKSSNEKGQDLVSNFEIKTLNYSLNSNCQF